MDYANKTLDGNCQQLTMYTNKCYSEYVPFSNSDYTYLKITNPHHDVNLINQNFINITAKLSITPKTEYTFKTEIYNPAITAEDLFIANNGNTINSILDHTSYGDVGEKIYIGWKNSGEIIEEMTVYNNGNETGFQQVHADRENYLESTKYMTATDKDMKRDCHLKYYNYFANLEREMPGVIMDIEKFAKPDYHLLTYEMEWLLESHRIYPISDDFVSFFSELNLTKGDWNDIPDEDFQKIVYYFATDSACCDEWKDFAFEYKYKKNNTEYVACLSDSSDQHEFANINDFFTYLANNSTYIPYAQYPRGDDKAEKFVFVKSTTFKISPETPINIEIPLIIPLKEIPAFNSLEYFERPFGDITLKLMLGPRSMLIFNEEQKCRQYTTSKFDINSFTITKLTCECYGYSVINDGISAPDEIWAPLRSKFGRDSDKSRIYESRFTVFKNFDGNMEGGRFHIQFPGQLEKVKNIHMVFPRETNETTVFRNPFLKDVKLKLDGVLYPREENIRTDDRMFYHLQAKNFELDDDVKYSYTCPALNDAKTGPLEDADKKSSLDDSNFILTYDLAVGHFMALHKYADNVNIFFTAEIIHYLQDMYGVNASVDDAGFAIPIEYTDTEPSPQIWFTHDACWKLNLRDGLTFMYKTCPSFDLYNNDKEDIFFMK